MASLRSEEKVRMPLGPFVVVSLRASVGDTEMLPMENAAEGSSQLCQTKQVSRSAVDVIVTSFRRTVQTKGNYNS